MVFRLVVMNVMYLIDERFNVNKDHLRIADQILVSQISNSTPINAQDEYFQPRVDYKIASGCHFTAVVHLGDFNADFTGGRFIFFDGNKTKSTVEPKLGRALLFTAGNLKAFKNKIFRLNSL